MVIETWPRPSQFKISISLQSVRWHSTQRANGDSEITEVDLNEIEMNEKLCKSMWIEQNRTHKRGEVSQCIHNESLLSLWNDIDELWRSRFSFGPTRRIDSEQRMNSEYEKLTRELCIRCIFIGPLTVEMHRYWAQFWQKNKLLAKRKRTILCECMLSSWVVGTLERIYNKCDSNESIVLVSFIKKTEER